MDGLPIAELRGEPGLEAEKVSEAVGHSAVEEGGQLAVGDLNDPFVVVGRLDRRKLDGSGIDLVAGELPVVRARTYRPLRHPIVPRDRDPVAGPRHSNVEQPALVGVASLVAAGREHAAGHQPILDLARTRRREPGGRHRRDEDRRPFQAFRPMHGGEVDGVELEVLLTIEALVRSLGIVDDVDGEVAVVPVATILAADLLAWGGSVWPGTATD